VFESASAMAGIHALKGYITPGMQGTDANIGNPGEALLRLLSTGAAAARAFAPADWESILALAQRHGVAPLLHRQLHADGLLGSLAPDTAERLAQTRRETALANLRLYGEFRIVAQALHAAGIPLMALKGLHLAELVYRDIGLRPMSDLDILVPRDQLRATLAALYAQGYRYNEVLAASEPAMSALNEITVIRPASGISVDVHWGLNEIPHAPAESLREIWRCARAARLGDSEALVMPPELLLVHLCAHAACANFFVADARVLCDVAEILRAYPGLDWDKVVEHGSGHGWTRGVAAALRLARDHYGVPVPEPALKALGGDALDPALLADAIAQLLAATELPEGLVTAPNLIALSGSASLREKAALLSRRLFPPRAELALLYGVPADAPRLPLYYALRLRDLARRYAAGAVALVARDPALAATAARHARLQRWITGGEQSRGAGGAKASQARAGS
jgi:hypothetical protein